MMSKECVIDPNNPTGNMFYRGDWAYCPEYDTGDVVKYKGILYLSVKHNAGKPPDEKENREYWEQIIAPIRPHPPDPIGRRVIDGGYATTEAEDKYDRNPYKDEIDGGTSSDRTHVRLI